MSYVITAVLTYLTSCVAAGFGRHAMPRPRAITHFIGLYCWPWQLIACSIGVAILKFVDLPLRKT